MVLAVMESQWPGEKDAESRIWNLTNFIRHVSSMLTLSLPITEAIRGEGGILLLPNGERFMNKFHKDGELAPRDVVARAIDHEMKRIGCDCLYLDISHRESSFIKESFPNVYEECLKYGVDITKDKIPVVPAAHYTCGV